MTPFGTASGRTCYTQWRSHSDVKQVERLYDLLTEWSKPQAGVHCVIVKGAGDKAFCAGGDVKWVVQQAMAGHFEGPDRFFRSEYTLNLKISQLQIPYIALMDGITMGGGAGVSIHGHFRVATERTVFAMPECGIGLFPDIGATFFLQRLPGQLGCYLGLTGARLKGVDVRNAGLATHYMPSSALPQLEANLQGLGPKARDCSVVNKMLTEMEASCGPLPQGELPDQLLLINRHFGHASIVNIQSSLQRGFEAHRQQAGGQQGLLDEALKAITKGSPLSQHITFELLKHHKHTPLFQVLEMDYNLARRFTRGEGDFYEGVRATLIDRGSTPSWKYSTLQDVPREVVESFFMPVQPANNGGTGSFQSSRGAEDMNAVEETAGGYPSPVPPSKL